MRAVDIIQKKRDGLSLSQSEIQGLIKGYTNGDIPDYQMSSFAMAVFFRGMNKDELGHFTKAMLHSGKVFDLSYLRTYAVDKHSTGGIGDKISIPLAPAVAACGLLVPMISGRGLGHTGGTLDKLESIPGFNVSLSSEQFLKQLDQIGCSLIGQTSEVAPADKKLYALRDVTATVECIPLIASSIMSKKLAEGVNGLVLDVKYGSGAFLVDIKESTKLAKTMVDIGTQMGTEVVARLTNMDQPIGVMAGNALEILESLDVLEGKGPKDTIELVVEFGAEMLLMGKVCANLAQGRSKITEVLKNGRALEKFAQIIEAQGGNAKVINDRSLLGRANKQVELKSKQTGYLKSIDARSVGIATMLLGGGRLKVSDKVDPLVGVETHVRIGDKIDTNQTLFVLHSNEKGEREAIELLEQALIICDDPPTRPNLFGDRITKDTTI